MFNAEDARKISKKYVATTDYLTKILHRIEVAATDGRRSLDLDFITEYVINDIRNLGFNVFVDNNGVTITW